MSALRDLQNNFLAYVRTPQTQMHGRVVDTPTVPAEQRLRIYADAYRLRLIDALRDNYLVLNTLLGDDAFDELGSAYLDAHPSQKFSVRFFGDQLSEFLRAAPAYSAQPIVSEMAKFEWVLRDVFDAPDAPVLTLEDLATVPPEAWPELKFALHPTLRRIDLSWNTPTLWKQLNEEQEPDAPQRREHPVAWRVWRRDLNTYFCSMEVDEAWAIEALGRGASFAELCAGLCEWVDEQHAPQRAAGFLQQWIAEGVLHGRLYTQ